MASSKPKVYLDHHIKRDNLLYQRSADSSRDVPDLVRTVALKDLGRPGQSRLYRKPDFQRATWAWEPEECVDLLEAALNSHVVPSVILWLSPENHRYVLDGAHRISVLLAWVTDDWGENAPGVSSSTMQVGAKRAAEKVRELLEQRNIGRYADWDAAARKYEDLRDRNIEPEFGGELTNKELHYAKEVRGWESNLAGFPILWVHGDYSVAERSFLKINKTGRRLSEWETALVENRESSFARTVVSMANAAEASRCWPVRDADGKALPHTVANEIKTLLSRVSDLSELVLEPAYLVPIRSAEQPLLAISAPRPDLRPIYLSELLAVTQGTKGLKADQRKLLEGSKGASPREIVAEGLVIVDNALDAVRNIEGPSPRSLSLVSLLYFYNQAGSYVRSLLYGLLYWLANGDEEAIEKRKLLFTKYRGAIEAILLEKRDDLIGNISRRRGSGPEVTYQVASFYQRLLELLVQYDGRIDDKDFKSELEQVILLAGSGGSTPQTGGGAPVSQSRLFRGQLRSQVQARDILKALGKCELCGGFIISGQNTQLDHIQEHSKGGATTLDNARQTHPYCNNSRRKIEQMRSGELVVDLPEFKEPSKRPATEQLSFLSEFDGLEITDQTMLPDEDFDFDQGNEYEDDLGEMAEPEPSDLE